MAEFSLFWTTGGTTGHQQTSYTQAQFAIAAKIYAACSGYEGVAVGYLNELEATATGANQVSIDTGGAMVDGRAYQNDTPKAITIPSAVGSGNTRIDRIVVRSDNSGYIISINRIAGTDAASPTPPAISQSSGGLYDIKLYQALVDISGNITLIDERDWALGGADEVTLTTMSGKLKVKDLGIGEGQLKTHAVTSGKIADAAVTNVKLADPYDIVYLMAAESDYELVVENWLKDYIVPDTHNGKSIVSLKARLKTASTSGSVIVRVWNVTKNVAVGTVTIPQGSSIATQTVITTPTVNTDDIIRVDVTSSGSGAFGLDVLVKVNKA